MARRMRTLWLLILKETQTIVTLMTAFAILHLRNLHSVYLGAGATLAAIVAKILKRFIKQPRPDGSYKKTYGMPSTHSSSISFFGVYLSLCIARLKPHPRFLPHLLSRRDDSQDFNFLTRTALTIAVLYGAFSVMWSRVKLTHHTPAQVIVGGSVGASLACLCFWFYQARIRQYAPIVERIVEDSLLVLLESWQKRSMEPIASNVRALASEWQSSRDGQL